MIGHLSLRDRYGGRRGLLNLIKTRLKYQVGLLGAAPSVEWGEVRRFVFLCRGNVCRSPFAEAVAVRAGLPATSFGLHTDQGTGVNLDASRVALALGVDMRGHKSRSLTTEDLCDGDLVLGMEPDHLDDPRLAAGSARVQIALLGLLNTRSRTPYFHDPYGLSDAYFGRCFRLIQESVEAMAGEWQKARIARHAFEPAEGGATVERR